MTDEEEAAYRARSDAWMRWIDANPVLVERLYSWWAIQPSRVLTQHLIWCVFTKVMPGDTNIYDHNLYMLTVAEAAQEPPEDGRPVEARHLYEDVLVELTEFESAATRH